MSKKKAIRLYILFALIAVTALIWQFKAEGQWSIVQVPLSGGEVARVVCTGRAVVARRMSRTSFIIVCIPDHRPTPTFTPGPIVTLTPNTPIPSETPVTPTSTKTPPVTRTAMPSPTSIATSTSEPTVTSTNTPGPTETPIVATVTPIPSAIPTATNIPTHNIPVMIEVQNYLDYQDELAALSPFYVYGWVVDAQIGDFDAKLAALTELSDDPNVVKRFLMFSSYGNLAAKIAQIPFGVGVFYNSEPGLSADYNDIFIEGPENSVVKFAALAEQHGLESHWGPMRRNFEPSVSDHVNDATLRLIFDAGLDGIGLQEQQQIDDVCVPNIVWGPNFVGAQVVESVSETVTRIRGIADGHPFEVNIQIMPGYNHTDGCYPGDTYAVSNCGLDPAHPTYEHCRQFVVELDAANLADSISIWASVATERQQLVSLVQALRR